MLFPCPELLVRIGIADAYGAGAEYLKFPRDNQLLGDILKFERYYPHPTHQMASAAWTDDTEMSVANARVLIEHDYPFTPLQFADAYVREFKEGGQRNGYAQGFQHFLKSVMSGTDFLARIRNDSDKNGAAMRAMPIGALPAIETVLETATVQACVTHNSPAGRFSARAVAAMAWLTLHTDTPLRELSHECASLLYNESDAEDYQFEAALTTPWDGSPVKTRGATPVSITTVHAVSFVLRCEPTLMGMLRRIISWGGDTDSVAAIAWGIAAPRFAAEELPSFMLADLEGGAGASQLLRYGTALMAKYTS